MPTYKLMYFNARGRAELVRLLFAAAGVKFEDARYTREEWLAVKESTPAGQLPVLEVDGNMVCQGIAIANYVAREHGLYGKNNWEHLKVDEIVCLIQDLFACYLNVFRAPDDKKEELQEKLKKEDVPKFLKLFETFLEKNGKGVFVGDKITYADIAVFDMLYRAVEDGTKSGVDILKEFPKLAANRQKVISDPRIKEYLAKRPVTEF